MINDNPLKLGLFCINCNNGVFMSDVPTSFEMTWEHNLTIATLADELGFEFIIPVARWLGFGGRTNFHSCSFETMTYAAGLAARTKNIVVASTIHAAVINPVVAAKAMTTIDHISNGRAALNVVMNWYPEEMRMLGLELKDHDDRYAYGSEWMDVVDRLWSCQSPFDFQGRYLNLDGCVSQPKPIQTRPIVINAGGSPQGINFAARFADFNFTSFVNVDQASRYSAHIRNLAKEQYNRAVGLLTQVTVVCRETEKEAQADYQAILDHADLVAGENYMSRLNINSKAMAEHMRVGFVRELCASGGNPALVGTPEQVADGLENIKRANLDGVLLGFVDYVQELPFFGERVMPILRDRNLRL